MFLIQVIKKRYEAEGDACQTDEFLKPIIVDPDGRIEGIFQFLRQFKQSCWHDATSG